ncbi:hypothetical protein, partial [Neisseria sicca]|uniref:hypothetical protein n=1 Tax=Neisseria sicca TaxID=490 RepID=UPI002880B302
RPVTPGVAGSSPVRRAKFKKYRLLPVFFVRKKRTWRGQLFGFQTMTYRDFTLKQDRVEKWSAV